MKRQPALILLTALLLPLVLAPLAPAQRVCSKCKGEKYLVCKKKAHDHRRVCLIKREHKCSACFETRCCSGLGKTLCPRCNDPVAEAELEDLREARKRWLDDTKAMNKKAGLRYAHVETDNYFLHVSLPRWKTKQRALNKNLIAHVFADRLEANRARIEKITGLENRGTHDVWVLKDARECKITTLEFMSKASESFYKIMGRSGKFVIWPKRPVIENDRQMHAALVHHGTHLVMASIYPQGDKRPRWLEVGMAHWLELDEFDTHNHYCFNETQPKNAWESANWKRKIAAEVRTGKASSLAEFVDFGLERLDHRLHAYCWSYVDFIISGDESRRKDFFHALQSSSTADAIDSAYGKSLRAFHDAWVAFVRSKYVF